MIDFLIPRYEHASVGVNPKILYKPWKIEIAVSFDLNSLRELPAPDNRDWNKLAGFSLGFINNKHLPERLATMVNSFRIGWRVYKNKLQFAPYQYNAGERIAVDCEIPKSYLGFHPQIITEHLLDSAGPDRTFRFVIWRFDDSVWYKGNETCMLTCASRLPSLGMLARPYHGGNLPAQADITGRIAMHIE